MQSSGNKAVHVEPEDIQSDDAQMFDLAPVSLWLEDYSGIKRLFDQWRQDGITDLRDHLRRNTECVAACSAAIRVIKVNRKTLTLFEADDLHHLTENLGRILRDAMFETHVEELAQMWEGRTDFASHTVNYTLSGRRLDLYLKGSILPGYETSWERVLLAIEDCTSRETARRHLAASEQYARGLFEHSPVSLWVEDFSGVKKLLDEVRSRGISDFRTFTDVHPEFVDRCISEVRVIDVNNHTLQLFAAPDRDTLLNSLSSVFREEMHRHFREQLIDLWEDKLFQRREVANYALDGSELHLHLQFSVFPGYEGDWSLVQVALTDITARKKAEAYLEFLGKHDVLTRLHNRSFYADELNRLERKAIAPVTIVIVDLNGLKAANDEMGHVAGDALLRRFGEVLLELVAPPWTACRIGGDEFAVLMPGGDEADGLTMMDDIHRLVEINNQFYGTTALSFSIGAATAARGERLESVVTRADTMMYAAKRAYYTNAENDRREPADGAASPAA